MENKLYKKLLMASIMGTTAFVRTSEESSKDKRVYTLPTSPIDPIVNLPVEKHSYDRNEILCSSYVADSVIGILGDRMSNARYMLHDTSKIIIPISGTISKDEAQKLNGLARKILDTM